MGPISSNYGSQLEYQQLTLFDDNSSFSKHFLVIDLTKSLKDNESRRNWAFNYLTTEKMNAEILFRTLDNLMGLIKTLKFFIFEESSFL